MGTPAEHRSLLAHLINVRTPYSYENPRFVLMCEGITELTEEPETGTGEPEVPAEPEDPQIVEETELKPVLLYPADELVIDGADLVFSITAGEGFSLPLTVT